jgi:DNA-binding FrmR family transcriptional regulator
MSMDEWIREEAQKYAEEQFAYFDREYEYEKWWQKLKKNLKTKGIKDFIYEFTRRCLAQNLGPEDYDLVKALENAQDYTSVESAIKELEEKHLFPPPPPLERSIERFEKEEEKAIMEEAQYMLKRMEEEPRLAEIIKRQVKGKDYAAELKKTKKQVEELKKMLEEERRKAREALEELRSWRAIVNALAGKIWREWARKPEKPKTDYYALLNLISFFINECRRRSLDPAAIKIEEKIKHYLPPEENRKIILDEIGKYKTVPIEEIKKLEAERDEWKRKAEEAEKRYLEEKRREEALKPPKPILGDREYGILLKEFLDQVEDRVILSRELREGLQRIFKLEWEANKIAYMDFKSAEDFVRDLAEKWAKIVEAELKEYKGLIPKVEAETEKKIALDYEKLAREVARRMEKYMPKEYAPPTLIPEVPKRPTQPIPREPISEWMGPFPRRLTEEEYSLFWEHYAWELWRQGINPYSLYNQEIFAKEFRDLEYKSWEQVLERFRQIIDAAVKGKPIPKLPRREIPIFKEIPREPILWVLVGECEKPPELRAKRLEEVVEDVKDETGVTVTVDDVKRIVEEEYRRGVDAHSWFKTLWEKYPYYLWNLGFKFKELEEKARNKVFASLGSNPETLKELIDFVQSAHGYIVSEEEAKRWIREELEKPPEQANAMILLRRKLAEKLVK